MPTILHPAASKHFVRSCKQMSVMQSVAPAHTGMRVVLQLLCKSQKGPLTSVSVTEVEKMALSSGLWHCHQGCGTVIRAVALSSELWHRYTRSNVSEEPGVRRNLWWYSLSPSTSLFPCQNRFTNAPYSLLHLLYARHTVVS
jgi:hypothetical protein